MSIRWIRNVKVNNEETTLEILLGDKEISDKCYYRINGGAENWFTAIGETRNDILNQGINILKKKFSGKKITTTSGDEFDWE